MSISNRTVLAALVAGIQVLTAAQRVKTWIGRDRPGDDVVSFAFNRNFGGSADADALLRPRRLLDGGAYRARGERREVHAAARRPRQGRAEDRGVSQDPSARPRAGAAPRQRR